MPCVEQEESAQEDEGGSDLQIKLQGVDQVKLYP